MSSSSIPCCSQESLASCAKICVPYSAVGILFMFWVVVMITKQPLYILGMEDEQHCKESAIGALGLFIVTFIGSLTFSWYDAKNREMYHEISRHDTHDLLPNGMSQYNVRTDSELELMGVESPPPYHDDAADDDANTDNNLINLPAFS